MTRRGMDDLCACLGDLAEKLCSDAKTALEGPKATRETPREAPREAPARASAASPSRSVLSVPLEVEKMEAAKGGGVFFEEVEKNMVRKIPCP